MGGGFREAIQLINRRQTEAARQPGEQNPLTFGTGQTLVTESEGEKEEKAAALEAARVTGGLEEQVSAEKKKAAALSAQAKKKTQGRRSTILTSGRGLGVAAPGQKKTLLGA
jgi:hypothetical protein